MINQDKCPVLNIFICSKDIRHQVVQNYVKFCMLLAPKTLVGTDFLNFDRHYKIQPRFDHCAKFHADRTELEINKK